VEFLDKFDQQKVIFDTKYVLITREMYRHWMEHLIQKHVEPGSKIHTDESKSYSRLERLGYEHYVVNHTNNFVDPITDTHTQTIETNWRQKS
jgi:hypothetical protein